MRNNFVWEKNEWVAFISVTLFIAVAIIFSAGRGLTAGSIRTGVAPERVIDIPLPPGYERVIIKEDSYADWLRKVELKQPGSKVHLYNGLLKSRQDLHYAVLDVDVGEKDLQQCADAVMRLRAEYFYSLGRYNKIGFMLTSGDQAGYTDWAEGKRPVVKKNRVYYTDSASRDYSYPNFRKYLDFVFTYAGSYSLSKELTPIKYPENIEIGDVYIQGGFPGHAVTVIDLARSTKDGSIIFLLAQSYMPAQEIHILKNLAEPALSPWYSLDFGDILKTPEWDFQRRDLKRFP